MRQQKVPRWNAAILRIISFDIVNQSASAKEAEEFFHERIPITRAMGMRVIECDPNSFVVEAAVALNHNHLQTAFGGSINAVATLAAYGLLWLQLRDVDAQIVVAQSSIKFVRSIRETIRARCVAAGEDLAKFRASFVERQKARISLRVTVEEDGATAAEFKGSFVARSGIRP